MANGVLRNLKGGTCQVDSVSKKFPLTFLAFSWNGWEFLVQILQSYYAFLSTPDCRFLFGYLQLWRSYAILSATTQRAFRPMVDILSIMMWTGWSRLTWHNFVKVAGISASISSPTGLNVANKDILRRKLFKEISFQFFSKFSNSLGLLYLVWIQFFSPHRPGLIGLS